jgi:hypothetical protein
MFLNSCAQYTQHTHNTANSTQHTGAARRLTGEPPCGTSAQHGQKHKEGAFGRKIDSASDSETIILTSNGKCTLSFRSA